jgi:hypothetical protein
MITKEFITVKLDELHPYENNPRINDNAVSHVKESIKQCENLDPIEIDENGVILSGHTRLLALQELGYTETDVVRISGLDEDQKRKYRILANKTNEIADWDFDKLAEELDGLDFDGFDFGFDGMETNYSPDEFTEDFSLPDGEKPEMCTMSFTLHAEQKQLIEYAMSLVTDDVKETFGNTNKNGNALYEVVRQWAEQRK